jgi:hypothetical protein
MFLFSLLMTFTACEPLGRQTDARAYATEMQSLFVENRAISREFLDVAALIKKESLDAHQIAERFEERVVPRAVALSEKVDAVDPGRSGLTQVHAGIERAWTIRADAYTALAKAWKDADNTAFSRALHDNRAVRKAEERYIEAANQLLVDHQIQLDPYP